MQRQLHCFDVDARRVTLDRLLRWCREDCGTDHMLFAFRTERHGNKWVPRPAEAHAFAQRKFAKQIKDEFLASAWPGTSLTGHPGAIVVIEFDKRVEEIILETEPVLANWLHSHAPPLPEDLCLFQREKAFPTLITVTHEGEGWIISDKTPPSIRGVRRSSDYTSLSDIQTLVGSRDGQSGYCRRWHR